MTTAASRRSSRGREWRSQTREHDVGRGGARRWRALPKQPAPARCWNIHDLKAPTRKRSGIGPATVLSITCCTGTAGALMPRPFRDPKRDLAAQNAFKNGFPDAVRKACWTAARRRRHPCASPADAEARFGRMNRLRPCWAPIGTRPEVAAQLIREYIYLYGVRFSKGWYLRLSDHADLEHSMLPAFLPHAGACGFVDKTSCWCSTARPIIAAATCRS